MDGVQLNANNTVGVSENSRREKIKTGLLIASGVLLAGVSIFAAVQHKQLVNLKNTVRAGELRDEIKSIENWLRMDATWQQKRIDSPGLSDMLANAGWRKSMEEKLANLEHELAKLTKKLPGSLA